MSKFNKLIKPLRYLVRHLVYHADSTTPETVIVSYHTDLDSMTPPNQKGVQFTPYSLSCAIHTASRYFGEVFADYGEPDYELVWPVHLAKKY